MYDQLIQINSVIHLMLFNAHSTPSVSLHYAVAFGIFILVMPVVAVYLQRNFQRGYGEVNAESSDCVLLNKHNPQPCQALSYSPLDARFSMIFPITGKTAELSSLRGYAPKFLPTIPTHLNNWWPSAQFRTEAAAISRFSRAELSAATLALIPNCRSCAASTTTSDNTACFRAVHLEGLATRDTQLLDGAFGSRMLPLAKIGTKTLSFSAKVRMKLLAALLALMNYELVPSRGTPLNLSSLLIYLRKYTSYS
jgi:hypothetical protein